MSEGFIYVLEHMNNEETVSSVFSTEDEALEEVHAIVEEAMKDKNIEFLGNNKKISLLEVNSIERNSEGIEVADTTELFSFKLGKIKDDIFS